MIYVEKKKLPNGSVPFNTVKDAQTRGIIMRLNENIVSLKKQNDILVEAVVELQKKAR